MKKDIIIRKLLLTMFGLAIILAAMGCSTDAPTTSSESRDSMDGGSKFESLDQATDTSEEATLSNLD